jgi:ubiquinone/menaquinone biosynthesis C-methylase UbiE
LPVYTHGHHDSVLRSHRWRTVENSAGYLIPHLKPGLHLLDAGCGPGTITADFAARLSPGKVCGIDSAPEVIEAARRDHPGVDFEHGDVCRLDFEDASWDIVHAHQVLQHLSDPVAALREMRRVVKPGGIVAVRDSDYATFTWHPGSAQLQQWLRLYQEIARANGGEPDAGRRLPSWAQQAGFTRVDVSASAWCFATPDDRVWWGGLWADRITASAIARQAQRERRASAGELAAMAAAWRAWAAADDGWFAVLHGEIICTR